MISIEWRDRSSGVLTSITDSMVLEYTISLVADDLHGQQFTCIAVAGATTYTEIVEIEVESKCSHAEQQDIVSYSCTSLQSLLTL